MNKEYKEFQRNVSKKAHMDSIDVPDIDKIKKLNDPQFHGQQINRTADEIFSGDKFNKKGSFDKATKIYQDPARGKKEEAKPEENFEDFEDESVKKHREREAARKAKKFGGKLKKIIIVVVLLVVLAVVWLFFFPPFMKEEPENTKVLYDKNIFEEKGMTEFKTYALSNYSVWNGEAFSSENPDNYRVISFKYKITNPTPFEVKISQYKVVNADGLYTDKICYCTAVKTTKDGTVAPDVIPGFSSEEVDIEVLINVTDMPEEGFDRAVTGLTIATDRTTKKIASSFEVPCLPAIDLISNNTVVHLNPEN